MCVFVCCFFFLDNKLAVVAYFALGLIKLTLKVFGGGGKRKMASFCGDETLLAALYSLGIFRLTYSKCVDWPNLWRGVLDGAYLELFFGG